MNLCALREERLLRDLAPPASADEPWSAYARRWACELRARLRQAPDARLNGSRTGPSQTFTASQIAALPLDHRDFSRMVLLSPRRW